MRNKILPILLCGCLLPAALLISCQRVEPEGGEPGAWGELRMNLTIDRWDAPSTKSGESEGWADGDAILIQLLASNDNKAYLRAVYSEDSDSWWYTNLGYFDVNGYLNLSSGTCICYFIKDGSYWEGGTNVQGKYVYGYHLSNNSAIYGCKDGLYNVRSGVLEISAHLTPLTGRIRFEDWPGDDVQPGYSGQLYGLAYLAALDFESFEWVSATRPLDLNVTSSEELPYLYGSFVNPDNPSLTVYNPYNGGYFYKQTFDSDFMQSGKSNYCLFPVEKYHNEWFGAPSYFYVLLSESQSIWLRYTPAGTFRMGGEDAQPEHKVTLTHDFYMSPFEVTRDLWSAVMDDPDYSGYPGSYPVWGKSWDEIQTFITTLNTKTGWHFRLPTEAEWEFCARGGYASEGFRYSGSNDWGNVAIYSWGPSNVSQYSSNEIGMYDMSGNVSEWVSDWYAPYTAEAVTDPTGPAEGEVHVRRGGDWCSGEQYLTVTYRDTDSPLEYTGIRLVADIPNTF